MKFRLEPKELGKLLSKLRQNSGLSQAKISKVCDVNSPQYISNIERGQCLPSLKILKVMLTEYKVNDEDKKNLIDIFLKAAAAEVEDIFSVNLELKYNVTSKNTDSTNSYLENPSLSYSMASKYSY